MDDEEYCDRDFVSGSVLVKVRVVALHASPTEFTVRARTHTETRALLLLLLQVLREHQGLDRRGMCRCMFGS